VVHRTVLASPPPLWPEEDEKRGTPGKRSVLRRELRIEASDGIE
jgi:hypothetical protein